MTASRAPLSLVKRAEAPDAEVLARVAAGEVSALGTLYDRYCHDVRRVLARIGVAPGDLDDLVQECFLEVVRSARNYDGRANAKPWLAGLAVNLARRHRRSLGVFLRNLSSFAREPSTPSSSPEEHLSDARAGRDAMRALDALSTKKREVFALVVLEGMPGEEAARALGIPVATVWTRLHHARRELRAALEAEES